MQCSAAPFVLALFASSSALAQESAIATASDAFGERVGIEQIGLYDEGQVRGFDLQSSGAYRIEDAYFSMASNLNDPVLAGVSVRVGVNAARLAYPAPSGVVNYRLRGPSERNRLTIGGGFRDYGTTVIQADGSWTSPDKVFSLTGGMVVRPEVTWGYGGSGKAMDVGVVGGWKISDTQSLRAFASRYWRRYDGDMGMIALDPALPPPVKPLRNYAPPWAGVEAQNLNFGGLYKGRFGDWTLDASAFRSMYASERSDFTLVATRANGDASATTLVSPGKTNTSDSAEARLSRVYRAGSFSHLVSASVRVRHSEVEMAQSLAVPAGTFNLRGPSPDPAPPPPWSGARGLDTVDQLTGSLGYGLLWGERLQVRLGAHRTRYEKEVATFSGVTTRGEETAWFYNVSAVWSLTPTTSLFASYVTGLEESGFAPQSATNRNEVLPPVEAKQQEIGVRHALTDNLTLLAALFEVSKPTTGFRADGSFGLVGEVAHRGVEASLSGRIGEKTDVVLGAVSYEAEVTGPLVASGVVGSQPAGIAELIANASIERQLTRVWSLDAQVNYFGESFVDSRNTLSAPALTTVGLGARARFELDGRPVTFRVLASNLTDERGWSSSTGGLIWPIGPRTLRATFSMTFGG